MNFTEKEQLLIQEMKIFDIIYLKKENLRASNGNNIISLEFQFPKNIGHFEVYEDSIISLTIPKYKNMSNSSHLLYEKNKWFGIVNFYIYVDFDRLFSPIIKFDIINKLYKISTELKDIKDNTLKAIAFDALQVDNPNVLIDYIKEKVLNQ